MPQTSVGNKSRQKEHTDRTNTENEEPTNPKTVLKRKRAESVTEVSDKNMESKKQKTSRPSLSPEADSVESEDETTEKDSGNAASNRNYGNLVTNEKKKEKSTKKKKESSDEDVEEEEDDSEKSQESEFPESEEGIF